MNQLREHAANGLLAICGLFALLNVGYCVYYQLTRAEAGRDFHAYWYYGHYVRQGRDMYYPFLHNPDMLTLPVRYVDGVVVERNPVRVPSAQMAMAPAYTAPMLFFFSLFSWFSWQPATLLWFLCNLALMAAAPFLLNRLLPPGERLAPREQALVALIFFGLYSTRLTLQSGQVGFLVLVLTFGAFALMRRSPLAAGLLLGLAVSKYSLALPGFLLFVLMRKYRIVFVALSVQAAGLLAISALAGGSLAQTLEASWVMFSAHGAQEGINLTARLLAGSDLALPLLAVFTLGVLGALGYWLWRTGWLRAEHRTLSLQSLHVFNVLNLWTLLVAYHRDYDIVVILILVMLVVHGFAGSGFANLSASARLGLQIFCGALLLTFVIVAGMPVQWVSGVSPEAIARWFAALEGLFSLMLVYALAVSLWLLYRLYPRGSGSAGVQAGRSDAFDKLA